MAASTKRSVNHQYFIRAAPASAFRAITDPKWLTRWLCDRAEVAPKKGGKNLLAWNDGPTHTGSVVAFQEGQRIAFHRAPLQPAVSLTTPLGSGGD